MQEILKKDILYPEDIKILYNEYGLSYEQIAALLFTIKKSVEHLAYRQYKKLVRKSCKNCSQHFYASPYSRTLYCTRDLCTPYLRTQTKKSGRVTKDKDDGKIREYTSTTLMLIADDIMKGRSIQWMAKQYDRDIDDLTKYIEKITVDGSLVREQKALSRMRNGTELIKRGNQLL